MILAHSVACLVMKWDKSIYMLLVMAGCFVQQYHAQVKGEPLVNDAFTGKLCKYTLSCYVICCVQIQQLV